MANRLNGMCSTMKEYGLLETVNLHSIAYSTNSKADGCQTTKIATLVALLNQPHKYRLTMRGSELLRASR